MTRLELLRRSYSEFGSLTLGGAGAGGFYASVLLCVAEYLALGKDDAAKECLAVLTGEIRPLEGPAGDLKSEEQKARERLAQVAASAHSLEEAIAHRKAIPVEIIDALNALRTALGLPPRVFANDERNLGPMPVITIEQPPGPMSGTGLEGPPPGAPCGPGDPFGPTPEQFRGGPRAG